MGNYDYANARLRAMKGRLFEQSTYTGLADLKRVDDLIAFLAQSTYRREIESALARYMGARVVLEACRLHLANIYHQVRGFYAGEGARLVGVLLARWDLHNLKAILRGQAGGARPEDILETLVPAGDLDDDALRLLVRQPEPAATADVLRMWNVGYAQVLRAALAEAQTAGRQGDNRWWLVEVGVVLDNLFYQRLLASLGKDGGNDGLVREFLAREIDTTNLLAALRLRHVAWGPEERGTVDFLIPGGEVALDWLQALAHTAADEEALAMLRASKFAAALAGLEKLEMAAIHRLLDRHLAEFGAGFFNRDPLTIATAIGFISAQKVEARNIRLIAQGIAVGFSRAEIEQELL